jgi:hypothetical protein
VVGHGTTVTLTLPIRQEDATDKEKEAAGIVV